MVAGSRTRPSRPDAPLRVSRSFSCRSCSWPRHPPTRRRSGFSYVGTSDFIPQTPGVTGGAPGAVYNPAAWATAPGELAFWLLHEDRYDRDRNDWGLSLCGPLGFSMDTRELPRDRRQELQTYQLGLAGGDRRAHVGAAWRWYGSDGRDLEARSGLVLGSIVRPDRYTSVGLSGFFTGAERLLRGASSTSVCVPSARRSSPSSGTSIWAAPPATAGKWGVGVEVRPASRSGPDLQDARRGRG